MNFLNFYFFLWIFLLHHFQTSFLPTKDVYHVTKAQLMAKMDTMMGGRAAEELIFGPDRVTTGASKDLEVAIKY